MQTKLTLRLDDELINREKSYAKKSGKSVSQIVAAYFSLLDSKPEKETLLQNHSKGSKISGC
jgi:hypothetical protein